MKQEDMGGCDIHRQIIKFKTLKTELLPYIHSKKSSFQPVFDHFIKKQVLNPWRSEAQFKCQYNMQKLRKKEGQVTEFENARNKLKNESYYLRMQRRNLDKRLESHLLIRAAIKEVANYQQYELGKSKQLQSFL